MSATLKVLGTIDLRGDEGQSVQSVLQQPRRFALLVYLAIASREGPVQRDTVLGVFWPDTLSTKARNALGQAIHYLRRSLGPEAILSEGGRISVNSSQVGCDAVDFMEAVREERWSDALELYRGAFLPGFYDSGDSAEFEHWMDDVRREIQQAASEAAWKMAEEAEGTGDMANAVIHARKSCEWAGGTETDVRRLMELMGRLGDRTGVMEAYESLVADLRDYGTSPHPATEALLSELRERWNGEDRSMAVTAKGPDLSSTESYVPVAVAAEPGWRDRLRQWWMGLGPLPRATASVLATVVVMVCFLSLWAPTRPSSPSSPSTKALVVIEEWAEGDIGQIAPMVQDAVVTRLQGVATLDVVEAIGETTLKKRHGFVLRGRMLRMGDEYRANVHLVDGRTGQMLASTQVEQPWEESTADLDVMSTAIATFARQEIDRALQARRVSEAGMPNEVIVRLNLGRSDKATADSLTRQSSYDEALGMYRKADSAFAEAYRLAPEWDIPWVRRAENAFSATWADWRNAWESGGANAAVGRAALGVSYATQAIELNPDEASNYELRAKLLERQYLLSEPSIEGGQGDLARRAIDDATMATNLNPYRPDAWVVLGHMLIKRGDWDEAYWALGRAANSNTYLRNDTEIVFGLFQAAWESNNDVSARTWCDHLNRNGSPSWSAVMCSLYLMTSESNADLARIDSLRASLTATPYWEAVQGQFFALSSILRAQGGDTAGARRALERCRAENDELSLPYFLAWAELELGNQDRALQILDAYVRQSPGQRQWVRKSRPFQHLAP